MTTAAHIWLAAVIGIACGAALWPLVVSATVIAVIMLTLLGILGRRWLDPKSQKSDDHGQEQGLHPGRLPLALTWDCATRNAIALKQRKSG
ncbi:hypothetical protein VH570_24330 [Sphingobium sp. HT1-2]|uniref:hypothetical protein n=1 Tax=Sphingobium TaxID=165695 RepID=UPI0003632EA4|nr:hypothetical protein [Sphingobium yanoikuyae]